MNEFTYGALLRQGTERLAQNQIEDPGFQAKLILLHCSGLSAIDLITHEPEIAPVAIIDAFQAGVVQRLSGEPLQHILGSTDFFGLTLRSDDRALIPRPDSEIVVEVALSRIPRDQTTKIADLGTGTGALLLALLSQRPLATGTAVEANLKAASLASENIKTLDLEDRASVFQGSWTNWGGWKEYDLIISNPPYIRSDVIPTLAPEVRDHDPMDALDGGPDGLAAYREIISLGAMHMKVGAYLVLEIGYDQREAVTSLLLAAGFAEIEHCKDLGGHDRAIAAQKT